MGRDRRKEALLVFLFAAIVSFQLFIPPCIGMANNGDYERMIRRFDLGPANGETEEYSYFTPHWIYDPALHWTSDNFSSELILICGALLVGWMHSTVEFDIRILGAIHALLWIGCFGVLLVALRRLPGWKRWATAIAALFIFCDVSYVALCNSFYMDTAAFLFFGWAVVLWLLVVTREAPSFPLFVGFSIASALCLMSKSQHVPLGLFLFVLAAMAAFSFESRMEKGMAFGVALLIPLAAWGEYRLMPRADAFMPQYAVVFRKITERSRTPMEDLRELGLGAEYARYVGVSREPLADPVAEENWWNEFVRQATRGRVLRFHLRHPWRTAAMIYRDLKTRAVDRRLHIIGKYDRNSGFPPPAQARSFEWWTAFRSALFRIAPWHILIWFVAISWMSIRLAIRDRASAVSKIAVLCVVLAGMAVAELAICSLSDSGETERHLFLFQVITDFTILVAIAWAVPVKFGRAGVRA